MSINNQILESVWSDRWSLAGSVTTSAQLLPSSHSLTLIRGVDSLSPAIRSAMTAKSIIPAVQITTPTGTVTLLNAKIVNMSPAGPTAGGKGWIEISSWQMGATQVGGPVGQGSGAGKVGKVSLNEISVGKDVRLENISFLFETLLAGIHHHRH